MSNSEAYQKLIHKKEDELAEFVGRFQARQMMAIFNGEMGTSDFFLELYNLGKKEGKK